MTVAYHRARMSLFRTTSAAASASWRTSRSPICNGRNSVSISFSNAGGLRCISSLSTMSPSQQGKQVQQGQQGRPSLQPTNSIIPISMNKVPLALNQLQSPEIKFYSTSHPRFKSAVPISDQDDDGPSTNSSNPTNSTPFLLADIGEGISEVELLQWFVSPGDTVSQFDRICEVQSDKASVEITSRFDGTIERLCGGVGDMMLVGEPLLFIATGNGVSGSSAAGGGGAGVSSGSSTGNTSEADSIASSTSSVNGPEVMPQPTTLHNVDDEQDRLHIPSVASDFSHYDKHTSQGSEDSQGANSKVLTSPAVRKLGKEHNIQLDTVMGSGPGGRILKADILKLIGSHDNTTSSAEEESPFHSAPTTPSPSTPTPLQTSQNESTIIPLRGLSRLMVKSMTTSLQIPHMVYSDELTLDALHATRLSLQPLAHSLGLAKLTYMPFFLKAASLALKEYPTLNSRLDVEKMELEVVRKHDLGVAVDTKKGLVVVVVRGCEGRSVFEIGMELNRLYGLAAEGNLSEEDISNPTFTLSNIGAIGGTYMSPVVVPPQVAIGAMGKIQRLPRFINETSDEVKATRIMNISWGGDHRAIDGATMARFSNRWKSYCENPSSMLFALR